MSKNRNQTGVSLIELMIAISILAIILFLGVPSFQSFFESSRARTISNDMTATLQLARSEAIKRRETVTVCVRNADGSDCSASSTDWNDGWLIIDSNNNPIRVWAPLSSNINGNGLDGSLANLSFDRSGSASQAATFEVNVVNNERCINIAITGRVNVSQGVCP